MNKDRSLERTLRVVKILRETELTLTAIAARFHMAKSTINHINKLYQVRQYTSRTTWTVGQ